MQNDEQYIDRILNSGSQTALFSLVKKYEAQVFNLCFRILRNREEAEEVAQDAFLKSFKELDKLNDTAKYGGWLTRIAYHLAIDKTRKRKLDTTKISEGFRVADSDRMPDELLADKDRKEQVELLLSQLSEVDNAIVTLYYLDGLSIKEVAEITDLGESNVKVRLMRARDLLKSKTKFLFGTEAKDLY